jgi:hypothetical protein
MKAAIFSWVLLFFFLTGGLAIISYQFENSAQVSSADFVSSDGLDASTSASTIRRFRAGGRKFVAPAQTVTVSRISSHLVLPYGTIRITALVFRQTPRSLNVVLQI